MYKFKVLKQFSYFETLYNPRRETYQLENDVVLEWEKEGLVKVIDKIVKIAKKE